MQIIDTDTHLREGYCLDEVYSLEGEFAEFTPRRVAGGAYHQIKFEHRLNPWGMKVDKANSHRSLYDPGRWDGRIARMQPGGFDMEKRSRDFEGTGIDKQVVFGTSVDIPVLTEGPLGLALSVAYNDWVHGLLKDYTDVMYPVAVAPAGHPEAMAGELRRAVNGLGCKAGLLAPYSLKLNLDDAAFDDYYRAAVELDVPLFVHPNTQGVLTNRFTNFYAMHTLARPTNCSAALVALVIGGVFEKFPALRVAFFECGVEWLLYWMHRMDATYDYLRDDYAPYLTMKPSDTVRRNCYVTCDAREKVLPAALGEIGEDRVLMSSDYPHWDTGFPHVVKEIQERDDITDRQKEMILSDNPRILLRL